MPPDACRDLSMPADACRRLPGPPAACRRLPRPQDAPLEVSGYASDELAGLQKPSYDLQMQLSALINPVAREEVFVVGGQPSVTYVNRDHLGLERALDRAIAQGNIIVSLTGATKCGKTVLCHRVLREREYTWVDGGQIRSEADIWQRVGTELGQPFEIEQSESTETGGELGGELGVDASPFGIGGKVKITMGGSRLKVRDYRATTRPDVMYSAIEALLKSGIVLVIDDFHYISEGIRADLIKSLKGAIFRGLKVVLLSTPNRAFEAVKAEVELTGRFKHVAVPDWGEDDLRAIARSGFKALNTYCPPALIESFAVESQGSPLLMQQFCWSLCYDSNIEKTEILEQRISSTFDVEVIYKEVANDSGLPVYKSLAAGPQTRTDRIERPLINGGVVDIYQAILYAVAATGPLERLSYNEIRTSLGNILSDKVPQKLEVSNTLKHLAAKDASDQRTHRSIDWDEDALELTITDPFLRFYLRWTIARRAQPAAR